MPERHALIIDAYDLPEIFRRAAPCDICSGCFDIIPFRPMVRVRDTYLIIGVSVHCKEIVYHDGLLSCHVTFSAVKGHFLTSKIGIPRIDITFAHIGLL